jgi:hypothetical protein
MTKIFSILSLLFIIEFSLTGYAIHEKMAGRWVVEKNSSLNIQGQTNVNNFQCDVTEYLNTDTLFYASNDGASKLNFTNSSLWIDIKEFDCHSRLITNDFRVALKSDKNPSLQITFLSLDQFTNPCTSQSIKGIVDVTLANVTRRTELYYTIKTLPGNRIELKGSHLFTFSDFNLKAPKKMGGLIRTKDNITVNFHLYFKAI